MTPEQEKQFNIYGCVCRCLIKLSELENKEITKEEFINRYANRYSNWSTMLGVADKSRASELAKELNLCSNTQNINDKDKIKIKGYLYSRKRVSTLNVLMRRFIIVVY